MKWLVISLGLVAAVMILLGGLTTSWWSHAQDGLDASIGLREARMCRGDRCANVILDSLERKDSWIRTGVASYAAALLAGGLLLAIAGLGAAGKTSSLLYRTTLVAMVTAVVAGIAFVSTAPDYTGMTPSYSMYLYFCGAVLGMVAGVLATRIHRSNGSSKTA